MVDNLQVDMLQDESEVREVLRFVQLNAQSLLGVDTARVLPIAARPALKTKLNILGPQAAGLRADLRACCVVSFIILAY